MLSLVNSLKEKNIICVDKKNSGFIKNILDHNINENKIKKQN